MPKVIAEDIRSNTQGGGCFSRRSHARDCRKYPDMICNQEGAIAQVFRLTGPGPQLLMGSVMVKMDPEAE